MPGILGKKIGMTRVIGESGEMIPVTVVQCEPNVVTQVKTEERDGYEAVVLGFLKLKKPRKTRKFYHSREFMPDSENSLKKDDRVTVEAFKEVKDVTVIGVSKGKGMQGGMKLHNFAGGKRSHGSHHKREPGSIGTRTKPGRVHRGKRMAAHMGMDRITRQHVPVVSIDTENHLICLKGPVPGANSNLVIIQSA